MTLDDLRLYFVCLEATKFAEGYVAVVASSEEDAKEAAMDGYDFDGVDGGGWEVSASATATPVGIPDKSKLLSLECVLLDDKAIGLLKEGFGEAAFSELGKEAYGAGIGKFLKKLKAMLDSPLVPGTPRYQRVVEEAGQTRLSFDGG